MAKQLESIEIHPGENGGHRVVHNFKREAGKKGGAMSGGLIMERPKSEEHLFGASEGSKVIPHIAKALGLSGQPKLNAENTAGGGY
jgi:hypothetical protein